MTTESSKTNRPSETTAEVLIETFGGNAVPIQLETPDPEAAARRMAEKMFSATNLDELYGASKGKGAEDLVGRLITITEVKFQEYESKRGIIPLAVVNYTDEMTGEVSEFATGGVSLVPFLAVAKSLGEIPFKTRITSRTTKSGNEVLNFERP